MVIETSLGVSGCKVVAEMFEGKMVVRKYTEDADYANRLLVQAYKQSAAYRAERPEWLVIPEVLWMHSSHPDYDNYFGVVMEYVPFEDYVAFVETHSYSDVELSVKRIVELLRFWQSDSGLTVSAKSYVSNAIREAGLLPFTNKMFEKFLKDLAFIASGREFLIPAGYCHGDLTMSNFLFEPRGERIALVDWHDRTPMSIVFDLIKLRQDAVWHWTLLNHNRGHDLKKVKMADYYLGEALNKAFGPIISTSTFAVLEAVNYLRILSYVRESHMQRRLMDIAMKSVYI